VCFEVGVGRQQQCPPKSAEQRLHPPPLEPAPSGGEGTPTDGAIARASILGQTTEIRL